MKKLANFSIRLFFFVFTFSIVSIQAQETTYNPNQLLIKFNEGTSETSISHLRQLYNATTLSVSPVSNVQIWQISQFPTSGEITFSNINEVTGHANNQPEVNGAGLNFKTMLTNPGPATLPASWNQSGVCGYQLRGPSGAKKIKVAIMDTGTDYNCPQLSPFFEPGVPGYDFVNNDPFPLDDHGHGTHIAGIISRVIHTDDLPPIQFVSYKTHGNNGFGDLFNIILAVDRAIQDQVNIVNMSFSYKAPNASMNNNGQTASSIGSAVKPSPLESAILAAGEHGILVLASAGNYGEDNDVVDFPCFPASFSCPNILAVASADCSKKLSTFSNWGFNRVDIAAPGEAIEAVGLNCENRIKSGTSQATAITTGVAAILGTYTLTGSDFDYGRVKCAILQGAEAIPALNKKVWSGGVVNLQNAKAVFIQNSCSAQSIFTGSRTKAMAKDLLTLSPNPFSEALQIRFNAPVSGIACLDVWDQQGKRVYTRQFGVDAGRQEVAWAPNDTNPGVYTVRLQTGGDVYTSKAVFLR